MMAPPVEDAIQVAVKEVNLAITICSNNSTTRRENACYRKERTNVTAAVRWITLKRDPGGIKRTEMRGLLRMQEIRKADGGLRV
jgi:hypothetical protein